jgi:hypothetical protein
MWQRARPVTVGEAHHLPDGLLEHETDGVAPGLLVGVHFFDDPRGGDLGRDLGG